MRSERTRLLEAIDSERFDLAVIGAGINGAGIARDAALRGLKTLVLDKDDVGSGTTGWSTRLIHGGLRYLEYYEVPLVRESLREREILLGIAPHLVQPLPFLIPVYRDSKRGKGLIHMGMLAYDALSFDKSLPRFCMFSREAMLRLEPGLRPDGLVGGAMYYDAQVEFPERLALENALCAQTHGATILTKCKAGRLIRRGNRVMGLEFTDMLTGGQHRARASIVVNAAGPWLDEVLDSSVEGPHSSLVGGTKGSHIVVERFPGAPSEALYAEARSNGRPFFIIPWNGLYLIGTTDLRYRGNLDRIEAGEEEIDYLLAETNTVIPSANVARDDVLYSYAGVRPLPYQPAGKEGAITRRHIIRDHAPQLEGLLSIIGGKLTTYRSLAEQTVDRVFRALGHSPTPCSTATLPLPGGQTPNYEAFSSNFIQSSGLSESAARRLLRIYGTRAKDVLMHAEGKRDLLARWSKRGAIAAEIPFAFEQEMAASLSDVLLRRTMTGWEPSNGIGADEQAAGIAQRVLGWSNELARTEVAEYRHYVARYRPKSVEERMHIHVD